MVKLRVFLFNLIFWNIVFVYLSVVRYYKIGSLSYLQVETEIPGFRIILIGVLIGSFIAMPYSLMEIYLKSKGFYKYSLLRIIVNRTLIQTAVAFIVLTTIAFTLHQFDAYNDIVNPEKRGFIDYLLGETAVIFFVAAIFGNIVLTVFRVLQMKIGEDVFYNILLGLYKPAKEEHKTFLFIDLRSSTSIAEKLGHERYSYFIQDCFSDLHIAIQSTGASIYQYVGDEAVLTWEYKDGFKECNCVLAFFIFQDQLNLRKDYYQNIYGVVPEFKAGLNTGKVMTAEVGVIKRDIAYHSDVLNTAARIQGLCNKYGAEVLVTKAIVEGLPETCDLEYIPMGSIRLKGKNVENEIFEIKRPPNSL